MTCFYLFLDDISRELGQWWIAFFYWVFFHYCLLSLNNFWLNIYGKLFLGQRIIQVYRVFRNCGFFQHIPPHNIVETHFNIICYNFTVHNTYIIYSLFILEFLSSQEQKCEETFWKSCKIDFKEVPFNYTLKQCHTPLIKVTRRVTRAQSN